MNILALIVSYGTHQDIFLQKNIETLSTFSAHKVDIKVFCTDVLQCKHPVEYIQFERSIGHNLTAMPYAYLQQNIKQIMQDYDYVLYSENDINITESNVESFIHWNDILDKHNCCCGFIRYEDKDNVKYAVDFTRSITAYETIDEIKYIQTFDNVHSGCWLFSCNQIHRLLDHFSSIGASLEDRASNIYKSSVWPGSHWGIKKLIPLQDLNDLLVHHMPNKYAVDLHTPHGKLRIEDIAI